MNPKDQAGQRKPPLHLVPPVAIIHDATVLRYGAEKYGPYNWREEKISYSVYVSAAMRHLLSAFDGEDVDPESGLPHIAHARATLGILLDAISINAINDDRPLNGKAGEMIRKLSEG